MTTDAIWPEQPRLLTEEAEQLRRERDAAIERADGEYRRGFDAGLSFAGGGGAILLAEAQNRVALLSARIVELERGIAERDHAIRGAKQRAEFNEPCAICQRLSRAGTSLVCARCREAK